DCAAIKSLSELNESTTPGLLEHIILSPLNEGEISSLISKVEGVMLDGDPDLPRRVKDDTGGLPLFVMEWAYRYHTANGHDRTQHIDVGSLLEDRITSLPEGLRSLLEIVAVSRAPLEQGVLMELVRSPGAGVDSLYRLCREHILRRTMLAGRWALES